MVDPSRERTTHADGTRPSTNVASSHQSRARDARHRREPVGVWGEQKERKAKQCKQIALSAPLATSNHSNSNNLNRRRSSSSNRTDASAVTSVRKQSARWTPSAFMHLQVGGVGSEFAEKVMVEPPVTVDLGINSHVAPDVLCDSLCIALELGAVKPWLFGPVKDSGCKVLYPGSRVQRVRTRSDRKVEEDSVTLIEVKGEIQPVVEGHDVERVTATLKNPHRYGIHRRNIRDKLRVKVGVRIIAARDTMSAMAKLTDEIEESTSDVFVYGLVSHSVMCSHDELLRARLSFFLSAS